MTTLLNAILNFQYCSYTNQANENALFMTIGEIFKKFQYFLKPAFITLFPKSSFFVGIMKWFMKEFYSSKNSEDILYSYLQNPQQLEKKIKITSELVNF